MNTQDTIQKSNLHIAVANIVFVGRAVSYYMNHDLNTTEDCASLFDSFIEMTDNYLMNL